MPVIPGLWHTDRKHAAKVVKVQKKQKQRTGNSIF